MAHRMVVLEWLYKADQDFGFARHSLTTTNYYDQICFYFQQAGEKYLKAYIIKFKLKFEKLHDLVKLLKICSQRDKSLEVLEESCIYLTPFYFETRYADNIFSVCTKEQAENALVSTEKIQVLIRKKLDVQNEITWEEIKKEDKKVDDALHNEFSRNRNS